jgi:anaerobic selenocysteine-containing dehydrogenase
MTRRALEDLELFVTTDVEYSPTARLADYVVATKLSLETPGITQGTELIKYFHFGYGFAQPFAKYSPAVVDPPPNADVIEDWQLYYRMAQRLNLQLSVVNFFGTPGGFAEAPVEVIPLDMEREPTIDELLEQMCRGSHVPLEEVKKHPHGRVFDELCELRIDAPEPGNTARLDVGNAAELSELGAWWQGPSSPPAESPFLLVPRRANRVMNTFGRTVKGMCGSRSYNPAFLHPDDLDSLGLESGDIVEIRSEHAVIVGVAEADPDLKRGVVSMSHGFGGNPGEVEDARKDGANTNRLLSTTIDSDPVTGQPRMGAVPISVRALVLAPAD